METWFVIVVSLCLATFVRSLIVRQSNSKIRLPPGPPILKSIFLLLTNSPLKFEPILINLKAKYGPIFTLSFGYQHSIFIGSHDLAHQVLVQKGAIFSDRPKSLPTRNIISASYGPTWRLFRRNLATEVMHPSRIRSFSWARKWVLSILIDRLLDKTEPEGITVVNHFEYIMFSLIVMCFGEKLDEHRVNEIAKVQRDLILKVNSGRFTLLTMYPRLGKIFLRNRWKEFEKLRDNREQVFIPIIKSRIESRLGDDQIVSYVDTLVHMNLPKEEGSYNQHSGKLTEKEMVSMCSEFVSAGSETTSNSLQWIMANLVKYPHIQSKLYDEIVAVVGLPPLLPRKGVELESVINEEELQKMPYLKAVVLEGLRRHPPAHFVIPHKVSKEVEVQGYVIPQGAIVNFMVGEMGLDPKVWEDPMEFKPERFLANDGSNGVFDISGRKGIKMMPFGAGRRICPGSDLALLHLEYFVANLIWYFHWTAPDGYRVDLSEEVKLTVDMKHPLRACISPRDKKRNHLSQCM